MNINSIRRGIVIDHIPAGLGYQIFRLLELDQSADSVAFIMNATSQRMGRKDIIKIENHLDKDLSILGIFGETLTINKIDDELIIEKVQVSLPQTIDSYLTCNNPRCISTSEPHVDPDFELVDSEHRIYRCQYCDHLYDVKEFE